MLMQVQLPSVARVFFPAWTFSADSVTVFVQPPCAIECINICMHIKNPKHCQLYRCLDTQKYSMHQVNPWKQNVIAQVAGELEVVLVVNNGLGLSVGPGWLNCSILLPALDRVSLLISTNSAVGWQPLKRGSVYSRELLECWLDKRHMIGCAGAMGAAEVRSCLRQEQASPAAGRHGPLGAGQHDERLHHLRPHDQTFHWAGLVYWYVLSVYGLSSIDQTVY